MTNIVSDEKKFKLLLKLFLIIIGTIVVISLVRTILVSGTIEYQTFFKEILFSLVAAFFIASVVYIVMNKEIRKFNTKIMRFALRDGLTGLYNRHYFNEFITHFSSKRSEDVSFAIAFIDIDDFKTVNDKLGHDAGDCILKSLAVLLQDSIRKKDIVCRYGGEEFIIIFNNIDKGTALIKIEQMRINTQNMVFNCKEKEITISAGLSFGTKDDDIKKIIQEADTALYRAKDAGKNCVKVFAL